MLSKHRKAHGKANAKKTPRAARANQKSKATPRRPRTAGSAPRRSGGGGMKTQYVSAPNAFFSRVSGSTKPRAGAPAPHEQFPGDGIRIAGTAKVGVLTTGAASVALAAAGYGYAISPNGASLTTYTTGLFPAPTTDYVPQEARFYRRHRLRYAKLRYEPGVGTIVADWDGVKQISMSYDTDMPVMAGQTTPTSETMMTMRNVSFTPGVPAELVLVSRTSSARDDQLYYMTGAGDSVVITAQTGEIRQLFQGGVFVLAGNTATAGSVVLGTLWLDYEWDFYGWSNNPEVGNIPSQRRQLLAALSRLDALEKELKLRDLRIHAPEFRDAKSTVPSDDDRPDVCEFIDLSPKSNRSIPIPQASTATREIAPASRPPSLKGTRV